MKPIIVFTSIIAIALFIWLLLTVGGSTPENRINERTRALSGTQPALNDEQILLISSEQGASPTPKIAAEQCTKHYNNFSEQVTGIHQIIITALEQEIKKGKTRRELLSYQSQYKRFYSGFDDLILQARVNVERAKYQFASSASALKQWNGLSVIQLPNVIANDTAIDTSLSMVQKNKPIGLQLTLKENISKQEIYDLLDNNKVFNTYLESLINIEGSMVISPSILFIMAARVLSVEEFTQAVYLRSFTVNDVSVAILQDLPPEYLTPLIANTVSLESMPIFVQGKFDSFENIADLAAATHNVPALKVLAINGLKPSNEPGILTGMDIAIMNISKELIAQNDSATIVERYIQTLQYLKSEGYAAHGEIKQLEHQTNILFKAPNKRQFQSIQVEDLTLRALLQSIELIAIDTKVEQIPPDNSLISAAIRTAEAKKQTMRAIGDACASIQSSN